jgi:hypothetical protein
MPVCVAPKTRPIAIITMPSTTSAFTGSGDGAAATTRDRRRPVAPAVAVGCIANGTAAPIVSAAAAAIGRTGGPTRVSNPTRAGPTTYDISSTPPS